MLSPVPKIIHTHISPWSNSYMEPLYVMQEQFLPKFCTKITEQVFHCGFLNKDPSLSCLIQPSMELF